MAEIAVPRDRQGEFEPQMVKKVQSRLSGLDEKIIALYAHCVSGLSSHLSPSQWSSD
ncbi:MAG: transposase [Pseudanabaena sp.]